MTATTSAERNRLFHRRRKAREAGEVEVRLDRLDGGKPSAWWVPLAVAERIEAMCRKEAKDG